MKNVLILRLHYNIRGIKKQFLLVACWYESFERNKNIIIENIEDIRENDPLMYDVLKRQDIRDNHFHMAVGAVWQENGSMELDELLTEAERLMYADKEIYYKTSGAKRRKAR